MTNPPTTVTEPPQIIRAFDLKQLATLLVQEAGLNEGFYEATFAMGVIVGGFQPTPENAPFPGAALIVQGVNLTRMSTPTPMSVDASQVPSR